MKVKELIKVLECIDSEVDIDIMFKSNIPIENDGLGDDAVRLVDGNDKIWVIRVIDGKIIGSIDVKTREGFKQRKKQFADGQLVVKGKDIIQLDPSGIGGRKVGSINGGLLSKIFG